MGHADSTTNVGIAGIHIFNAYQEKNFKPFLEDMTKQYIEQDNSKVLLTEYSNWLSTTAIPEYFDEDIKSNSTIFINTSTLNNYLSKVIIMFKYNLTKHFVWEGHQWTTKMNGEEFEKKCKHEKGRGNVEVSENTKRGLYSKAPPWLNIIDDLWMSNIDI